MKKYMAKSLADHAIRHDDDLIKSSRRQWRNCSELELEDLPLREKMRPSSSTRARTLRTDVLENFLRSRLGLSWNDVYSEVCKTNRLDNFNQWELRRELLQLVAQRATRIGKRIIGPDGMSIYEDFWVDPRGLLRAA